MPLRVSFRSFGCKLNQAEADAAAASFEASGALLVSPGEAADLLVFNTCTVTAKAEQKARRELRLALRREPGAFAIVTGCYAELDPGAVSAIDPRVIVVPGSRKDVLSALAAGLASAWHDGVDLADEARRLVSLTMGESPDPFGLRSSPAPAAFRDRAQLKIQDGCDNACAYCRVRLARGRSVSLDPAEVLSRARALEEAGIPEIVLTGVNVSHYRAGDMSFPGLLRSLVDGTSRVAFRVSSYEPDAVDAEFIEAFSAPRVRPHLHLPAQSGSDRVLRAMGRRYGAAAVAEAAEAARAARGDPFVGLDLIVGFPGETDGDFADTMALIERIGPAWIHAFTFSPRPGTRAMDMKPRVPERIAVERAAAVLEAARRGKAAFASRRVGTELEAVVDSGGDEADEGDRAENYCGGAIGGAAERAKAYAVSADYLRIELRGAPPAVKGSVRCHAVALADPGTSLGGADLVAEYLAGG